MFSSRLRIAVLTTHDAVAALGQAAFAAFFARFERLGTLVPYGESHAAPAAREADRDLGTEVHHR